MMHFEAYASEVCRLPSSSTGKERDDETGNDYFGARYYASTMGRFMSPDWSAKVEPVPYAKLGAPQSLNLYSYVQGNPESASDLDGHELVTFHASNIVQAQQIASSMGLMAGTVTQVTDDGGSGPSGGAAQQQGQAQQIDKDKIVNTMDKNAHGTNTYNGYCASACRKGLQAGGVKVPITNGHYPNANKYGPVLLKNGASIVPAKGYTPEKGDVVVFEGGGPHNHPDGHIAIYDGKQWVSDTRQTQMAPNRSGYPGGYTIYRFPN